VALINLQTVFILKPTTNLFKLELKRKPAPLLFGTNPKIFLYSHLDAKLYVASCYNRKKKIWHDIIPKKKCIVLTRMFHVS